MSFDQHLPGVRIRQREDIYVWMYSTIEIGDSDAVGRFQHGLILARDDRYHGTPPVHIMVLDAFTQQFGWIFASWVEVVP